MADHEYANFILEQLEPLGNISIRRMFGGYSIRQHGISFALMLGDILYFKVDDSNRADYERAGTKPFTYEKQGKTIVISSWEVPAQVIDDQELLLAWAQRAIAASARKQRNRH